MSISLPDSTKLNGKVSLLESRAKAVGHPNLLIVLCPWLGAKSKHIAKYVERYQDTYPSADILILASSTADMSYSSDQSQRKASNPAREMILSHEEPRSVLLHAFSNAGAQSAAQLVASLPAAKRATILKAIVLDSCPGVGSYQRSANAMTISLPRSAIQRAVGLILIHTMLVLLFLCDRLFGVENAVSATRRRLLDSNLFPHEVPRLYLYSKIDEMVPRVDIQEHAESARRCGYLDVRETIFEGSGHCAHAIKHGDEYWSAVESIIAV